jgi:hypothetical protein
MPISDSQSSINSQSNLKVDKVKFCGYFCFHVANNKNIEPITNLPAGNCRSAAWVDMAYSRSVSRPPLPHPFIHPLAVWPSQPWEKHVASIRDGFRRRPSDRSPGKTSQKQNWHPMNILMLMPNHPERTPFSSANRRGIVVGSNQKSNFSPVRDGIVSLTHCHTTKCQAVARVKAGKTKFQAMPTASHSTAAPNVRPSRPVRPGRLPDVFVRPGFGCQAEARVKAGKTKFQAMPTASHATAVPSVRPSRSVRPGRLPGVFVRPGFGCQAKARVKAGKTKFQAMPAVSHATAVPNVRPSRSVRPGRLPGLFLSPGFGCQAGARVKAGKTKMRRHQP